MGNFRVLFLDDRSKRIHSAIKKFADCDLTIVATVVECLRFLSSEEFDYVFLDHDLGGREFVDPNDKDCGMEVVRYLENGWIPGKKKPDFVIHSSNSFAAYGMENRLRNAGYEVSRKRWEYD